MSDVELVRANHAIGNLEVRQPRVIVGVPAEGKADRPSMASLYVSLKRNAPATIAVGLYARLRNIDQLVGQVGVPPGYSGIAVVATGIVAEAWLAKAYGTLQQGLLDASIGVRECCSSFSVMIPAALQEDVPLTQPTVLAPMLPLARNEGFFNLYAGIAGNRTIAAAERVTRITATADPAAIALVSGVGMSTWDVPMGMTVVAEPLGNLHGPRTITFTNTVYYQVETVR